MKLLLKDRETETQVYLFNYFTPQTTATVRVGASLRLGAQNSIQVSHVGK